MQPIKDPSEKSQEDLFRTRLDQILNKEHPVFRLAQSVDWSVFEKEFGGLFVPDTGRPGLPTRLMVGLHYLKHLYDASDEGVVEMFLENPYWQYFCGFEFFQHEFPCNPTSLVKWRKRVGADGMTKLLQETIETAKRRGVIGRSEMKRVNVDTTVQEKAIQFPTDARLYHKMRKVLVREAGERGIKLRQSYCRVSKRSLMKQGQYAHAQQMKRARKETKRLKIYLGRVVRDIGRKLPRPDEGMSELLSMAHRLLAQKREDTNKLYSLHAPETECISKGKAHKKYEFGCKVSLVTTSRKGWVVGIDALHGNPFDGHTLKKAIDGMEVITGKRPEQAFVDKGYRGTANHPEGVQVFLSGRRGLKRSLKLWLRRRSAIEPVIGHIKHEHRMDRNYLLGKEGDRINAILSGSAFNLRKLMRAFFLFVFEWDLFADEIPLKASPSLLAA
jgi:IS5 family transposase